MLTCFCQVQGQESDIPLPSSRVYKNAFELRHDNDFLLFTDRYYTTGSFIGIRSNDTGRSDSINKRQYRFFIQQEIYTPSDLLEVNIKRLDRPYAGFIGISNGIMLTNNRRMLDASFLFGFSGPLSNAEQLQSYFHESATEDSRVATWEGQIKNGLHANVYLQYAREWKLEPNPFSVYMALNPVGALGTKDIYLQNDVAFYFGKRNPMNTSAAYNQLGEYAKEWFFAVRVGYRYIFHDALLEGHIVEDFSVFLKEPYQNLFLYNFEMFHRSKRNNYKLGYNFATPATDGTDPHLYMVFSFMRSF
ncbi:MAG: lipid A deacylase LpxR family protein [Flavobacteriaceae bacterium]|nr:lipid A deacylase LpxR family protein [Flavobacteriaceae bacterium]